MNWLRRTGIAGDRLLLADLGGLVSFSSPQMRRPKAD